MQGPARLGLIYDMQTRQARGFARWKTGQDADMLNEWPAQRLIRIATRKEPRDWQERWDAAAAQVAYEGVSPRGMVSPVRARLFGPPCRDLASRGHRLTTGLAWALRMWTGTRRKGWALFCLVRP
jgi:hypothetical protein